MKKLLLLLIISVLGVAFAAPTYYNNTGNKAVEVVNGESFSLLMIDVLLQPQDTAYSRPFDLLRVPINYRDTGIGDGTVAYDFLMGTVMLSCYDVSDSAAVIDSVNISAQVYVSNYAGDNGNPNGTGEAGGKSQPYATIGGTLAINQTSDAQTIRELSGSLSLTTNLDRFFRVKIWNKNTTIKDRSRCRVYWVKKMVKR